MNKPALPPAPTPPTLRPKCSMCSERMRPIGSSGVFYCDTDDRAPATKAGL